MGKIALWSQNIVNHFWYCSRTCNGDLSDLKVNRKANTDCIFERVLPQEKWRGVLHHVCDVHEWYQGECQHDALTEPPSNSHGVAIPYFAQEDADFRLLQKILTDKRWMVSLKYFTRFRYIIFLVLHQYEI